MEARTWVAAVVDVRDEVFEAGADSAQAVRRFGGVVLESARTSAGRLAEKLVKRLQREDRPADDEGRPSSGAVQS